ncbi:hypothetical protein L1049_012834 [Liquidambar formosana]|uniref:FAS1 domain-containing protein n=1 Tax=Liquidambar formosana TaxID=63359 RepID=A0AAP0WTQ7_LIQFO
MMKQLLFSFTLLPLFLFHSTTTLAQSPAQAPAIPTPTIPTPAIPPPILPQPPAQPPTTTIPIVPSPPALAPAPASSTDIIKILKKVGHFTLLIRLMKNTQVADQINNQLSTSSQGLTVFAPTDNAFSSLRSGTLNSLTSIQQVQLLQFHILPAFLSTTQFQTASNPLRTQAGGTGNYDFPLNVTTANNIVNVTSGLVNATVTRTVYSDNQLAIYEVDKVLLPMGLFGPKPPASAPAPAPEQESTKSKPKKKSPVSAVPITTDSSGAVSFTRHGMVVSIGVAVIAAFSI